MCGTQDVLPQAQGALVEGLCPGSVAPGMGQGSQVVQAESHLRMRRAEGLCAYGQGALRERLRRAYSCVA